MNKYVFPGADASCALNWVIGQVRPLVRLSLSYCSLDLSLRITVLKSRILTFLVYTTPLPSGAGIRTGSPTRTRSSLPTGSAGTVYGSSSWLGPLSFPGTSYPRPCSSCHSSLYSQGGASLFQITCHKNLNAYHRINGATNHASIKCNPTKEIVYVPLRVSHRHLKLTELFVRRSIL